MSTPEPGSAQHVLLTYFSNLPASVFDGLSSELRAEVGRLRAGLVPTAIQGVWPIERYAWEGEYRKWRIDPSQGVCSTHDGAKLLVDKLNREDRQLKQNDLERNWSLAHAAWLRARLDHEALVAAGLRTGPFPTEEPTVQRLIYADLYRVSDPIQVNY